MPVSETDRLELIERQLTEKVTERVRASLFKVYATVGIAVIFVIGFVSWDIVDDIKQELKDEFIQEIEDDIDAKRNRIDELVIESSLLANRVNGTIVTIEKQLTQFQPKVDQLNETFMKVENLTVDARNSIDVYNNEIMPLVSNVNALSEQIRILAEQVNEINALASDSAQTPGEELDPRPVYEERTAAIQSVITRSEEVQQTLQTASKRNTVFLQYASGTRANVQELAARLQEKGFYMPGEERTEAAYGKREVRYFHPDDMEAANDLAKAATLALSEQGYEGVTITTQDLTAFAGKKPRSGVLELWVDLPRNNLEQSAF